MTANRAFDSSDSGALPGRSTTMEYTSACVATSASGIEQSACLQGDEFEQSGVI